MNMLPIWDYFIYNLCNLIRLLIIILDNFNFIDKWKSKS